jgi:hypothetical protein
MKEERFYDRVTRIVCEVDLAHLEEMDFGVYVGRDEGLFDAEGNPAGRYYYQIQCWRKDVITGEMDYGFGGKAYLSEHATDSELVQTIFGLYLAYWTHEARETFLWNGRRVFGPHIATEALHSVANRVDVRSARHEEDRLR